MISITSFGSGLIRFIVPNASGLSNLKQVIDKIIYILFNIIMFPRSNVFVWFSICYSIRLGCGSRKVKPLRRCIARPVLVFLNHT